MDQLDAFPALVLLTHVTVSYFWIFVFGIPSFLCSPDVLLCLPQCSIVGLVSWLHPLISLLTTAFPADRWSPRLGPFPCCCLLHTDFVFVLCSKSCRTGFWRAGMLGSFFSLAPSPSACPQKVPPGCLNRKKMTFRNSPFHCSQTTRVYPNREPSSWLWAFLDSVLL